MATFDADPDSEIVTKEVTWEYPDGEPRTLAAGTYSVAEYERLWNAEDRAWRKACGEPVVHPESKHYPELPTTPVPPPPQTVKQAASGHRRTAYNIGSRVLIQQLSSHSDLNGKEGVIVDFDTEKQRFGVKVDGRKNGILIRGKNLQPTLTEQMSKVTIEEVAGAGEEALHVLKEAQRMQKEMLDARAAGNEEDAKRFANSALEAANHAERLLGKTPLSLPKLL